MKKLLTFIVILLIIVAGYFAYHQFYRPEKTEITNFADCAAAGNPIMESYPRRCNANGKTFTEDIGNLLEKENTIRVDEPRPLTLVGNPIIIKGQARGFWFFEASFPVKLIDAQGNVLGTGIAEAQSDWMTENFVPFQAELKYIASADGSGRLILARDNPSGLPQNNDSLNIPIQYLKSNGKIKVKVFFQNSELDASTDYDCSKFLAVEREVDKTEGIARVALEELLKGPSQAEKDLGFTTTIPAGVKIQKLEITDGVAKVDFSSDLESGVGGSCRVTAIRAQISETLKQFSTVSSIIISINGRTEDILQP
ncbi:MAG: GerMN domain-containing protein [Patescibacteria group bacterium]|nr:GerMN domain-containing protein [Patescibacteria group bacterium]